MKLFSFILALLVTLKITAQSTMISSNNLQIPSLSSTQIQAIVSPQKGIVVFDNDLKTLRTFDGTKWTSGNAQSSNFESQNMALFRGNANNNDGANDMKIDADGNVYVLTSYRGTVTYGSQTFTNTHPILSFPALVKFNADGQILWAVDFGNSVFGYLSIDNSGNPYVGGSKFLPNGSRDYTGDLPFLMPTFAPNGNVYGTKRLETFIQTVNGFTFGCPGELNSSGIFAYDSNKNLLWVYFSCGDKLIFNSVFTDEANNCYFLGILNTGSYDFSNGSDPNGVISVTNQPKQFFGKYSATGVLQWVKIVDSFNNYQFLSPQFDIDGLLKLSINYGGNTFTYDGNLIVSANTCTNPQYYSGYGNGIELKINPSNGSLVSTQQGYISDGFYKEQPLMATTSNNVYNINALSCPLGNEVCPPTSSQKIILKRNKANEVIWATKTNARLSSIAVGKGKTIWMAGSFSTGNLTFGSVSLTTSQEKSMFLLRIKE